MVRRIHLEVAPTYPSPPRELVEPFVEDWASPVELAQHTFTRSCRGCARRQDDDCRYRVQMAARVRFRDARQRWLRKHNIPASERCHLIPASRPRWRDQPSLTGESQ